jgi:5'-nucleotidase
MLILATNDDGVEAPGLAALAKALEKALAPEGRVVVVAPEVEQSAVGHAITLADPIKVRKLRRNGGNWGWAVRGTPADCVKLAYWRLLEGEKPDLVVSGINRGANTGLNLLYSGTVSAATEAAFLGLTGMAFSLDSFELEADYGPAAALAAELALRVLERRMRPGAVLNVNFPYRPDLSLTDCVITRQGLTRMKDNFIRRRDPRGGLYYWQATEKVDPAGPGPDRPLTDQQALAQGRVSITPIQFDLTNHRLAEELGPRFLDRQPEN